MEAHDLAQCIDRLSLDRGQNLLINLLPVRIPLRNAKNSRCYEQAHKQDNKQPECTTMLHSHLSFIMFYTRTLSWIHDSCINN